MILLENSPRRGLGPWGGPRTSTRPEVSEAPQRARMRGVYESCSPSAPKKPAKRPSTCMVRNSTTHLLPTYEPNPGRYCGPPVRNARPVVSRTARHTRGGLLLSAPERPHPFPPWSSHNSDGQRRSNSRHSYGAYQLHMPQPSLLFRLPIEMPGCLFGKLGRSKLNPAVGLLYCRGPRRRNAATRQISHARPENIHRDDISMRGLCSGFACSPVFHWLLRAPSCCVGAVLQGARARAANA